MTSLEKIPSCCPQRITSSRALYAPSIRQASAAGVSNPYSSRFSASSHSAFFAERMKRKFGLSEFTDWDQPVVLYGMYKDEDFDALKKIKGGVIVWCGTDARVLNASRAAILKSRPDVRSYAKSKDVYSSLIKWGVRSEILPVTSTELNIEVKPRGEWVYCYVCSDNDKMYAKYKMSILKKLAKELKYKFIFTTIKKYKPKDLMRVYEKCFIGVRLLDHDGLSNSILEMGLMGRRTVSNSGAPGTIHWGSFKKLKNTIINEYRHRKQDNHLIHDEVRKYIDIGDKWLEV